MAERIDRRIVEQNDGDRAIAARLYRSCQARAFPIEIPASYTLPFCIAEYYSAELTSSLCCGGLLVNEPTGKKNSVNLVG
jgi:hypothetical protein